MISIDEISLCIINRNGVRWLPYSLGRLADKVGEIVFVDTGSKDESLAVAERLGARIFQIEWNDDFSHPRNVGLCHSRCNWILSLDSDEIVHLKDLESVLNQVDRDRLVGYRAIVRHYVSETESPEWIACQPDLHLPVPVRGYRISRNVKLFPNLPNVRYRFPVHETVAPDLLECGISIHDIDYLYTT